MNRIMQLMIACSLLSGLPVFAQTTRPFYAGADISMLPEIEKARGVYRDEGKPQDAIRILRDHGCNLIRLRLFVNPSTDFNPNWGATQSLPMMVELARRVKASGAMFVLDLHYSDTWADPGKQFKPKAWEGLDFDSLEKKVFDYTVEVLTEFRRNGAMPDMVQVGNEITSGMIWPDGKVLDAPPETEAEQWKRFSRLFNAGARAVRAMQAEGQHIPIILHIHGGGRPGLPKWFFSKFNRNPADYDIVGISFYPAWNDSIDNLKQNIDDIIRIVGKDVLVAETSYPWREMDVRNRNAMGWPTTKDGQKQFLEDLIKVLKAAPDGRAIGFMWWYPEAIPTQGLHIYRDGAEALFDEHGNSLPALDAFSVSLSE